MNSPNRLIFMDVTKNARVKAQEVMLRRETTHVPARKMREMARRIQGTIRKMPHCQVSKTAQQVPTRPLNFENTKTQRKRIMTLREATLPSSLNAHQNHGPPQSVHRFHQPPNTSSIRYERSKSTSTPQDTAQRSSTISTSNGEGMVKNSL